MSLTLSYSYWGFSAECYIWRYSDIGEQSDLYIHKWRVPDSIPSSIDVTFNFKGEYEIEKIISKSEYQSKPELLLNPIVKTVRRVSFHGKSVRFDTDKYETPFHSIYIPYFVLGDNDDVERLQVVVRWNLK